MVIAVVVVVILMVSSIGFYLYVTAPKSVNDCSTVTSSPQAFSNCVSQFAPTTSSTAQTLGCATIEEAVSGTNANGWSGTSMTPGSPFLTFNVNVSSGQTEQIDYAVVPSNFGSFSFGNLAYSVNSSGSVVVPWKGLSPSPQFCPNQAYSGFTGSISFQSPAGGGVYLFSFRVNSTSYPVAEFYYHAS